MIEKFDPNNLFLTSDSHYFHTNIIKYCNRPFSSVEEMNEQLINNWNSVVSKDSIIFHLGDFSMGDWCSILERLNGIIYLIAGNHDKIKDKYLKYFKEIYEGFHMIRVGKKKLILTHFPLLFNSNEIWNIHGHIHTTKNDCNKSYLKIALPNQYDVGVDFNDYTPISYKSLENKIKIQIETNSNLSIFMNNENM